MADQDDNPWDEFPISLSPSRLVLQNIAQSGNLDRLAEEARRFLENDPEDFDAHYFLALGLTDQRRFREAKPHVDFLLQAEPESTESLFAVIHWNASQDRWRQARPYIQEGMRIDPDDPVFYRYAAIDHAARLDLPRAKSNIARARELAPDDADIANLYIRIHGAEETSVDDAYRRLKDYQDALRLDPHCAELHNSIGDVYLDEIDDPVLAESHYREAVSGEPDNRQFQQDLFQAVAKRSLVYRLFSIPSRTFTWLGHLVFAIRYQPWRLLLLLIGIKFVAVFVVWMILATVLFWPGGKIYEWLLVSEIKRGAQASVGELRAWYWFRRWPLWLRFSLFLVLNIAIWGALFAFMGIPLAAGYTFVAIFGGVHFAVVTIRWWMRRISSARARKKMERKKSPPPLPKRQMN